MRFVIGATATTDLTAGSSAQTIQVEITWDEGVTVAGSPTLAIANGNQGTGSGRGPHNLAYASGTNTNELVFALVIPAGNAATAANDVLTVGANAMNLNGGTVKDRNTSTNSTITSSAGIGTAAGSLTVVA